MLRAEVLTLAAWIRRGQAALESAGCPSPRHDTERLAAHVLGLRWSDLWSHMPDPLDVATIDRLDGALTRRADWEPLAYITGTVVFYGIEIGCGPGVLVPRPETEVLVDVALELVAGLEHPIVVDIGTGSGAIAVVMASGRRDVLMWASDVSAAALRYAESNAARNGAEVTLVEGDLFDGLPAELRGRVDLVVSNPPYIAEGTDLPADVRAEPTEAVLAGRKGDEVLLRLVSEAPRWLSPFGAIALEVGTPEQAQALLEHLNGFVSRGVRDDQNGRQRVVWARR